MIPLPHAVADPALSAEGRAIVAGLFGDADSFIEHERWQRPFLRRSATSPFDLTVEGLWAMVDRESFDVSNAEFRVVRATPTGFDSPPVEHYAEWRRVGGHRILAPRAADVRRMFDQGYSIAAQLLDRTCPDMGRVCAAISAWTGHPSQVSAYLSPGAGGALQVHHDTHDVMILQGAGTKTYDLFDPVIDRPIPTVHLDPADLNGVAPHASITLEPGDMLYLPRGIPHRATSGGEGSLHLTIGLLAITWSSLMRNLAEELVYIADLRTSLAAGQVFDPAALAQDADVAAHALADWLRVEGGSRLAAMAAMALVRSYAMRQPADPLAPDRRSVTAIDPAPDGGATLHHPGGSERAIGMGEAA